MITRANQGRGLGGRMLALSMLFALSAGCKSATPSSGSTGEKSSGDPALDRALDDYAAALARTINVRCGQCWKELGHASEADCRNETDSDVLGDMQRSCFVDLAKAHGSDVKTYLGCRTNTATFYDDCFAKGCDLRRCAVELSSYTPSSECAPYGGDEGDSADGEDAGTSATTSPLEGVSECDPMSGAL